MNNDHFSVKRNQKSTQDQIVYILRVNIKSSKMASNQENLVLYSCGLIILLICIQVDAQFFTKSSKSIPRMGRRSDNSLLKQYRRSLIDTLIDEYGLNMVEALEAKAAEENRVVPGEVVFGNDQPIDLNRSPIGSSDTKYEIFAPSPAGLSRDERSSRPKNDRGTSLAMRALNTNRFIQHLASGRPLMFYDKLFNGQYLEPRMDQQQKFGDDK